MCDGNQDKQILIEKLKKRIVELESEISLMRYSGDVFGKQFWGPHSPSNNTLYPLVERLPSGAACPLCNGTGKA